MKSGKSIAALALAAFVVAAPAAMAKQEGKGAKSKGKSRAKVEKSQRAERVASQDQRRQFDQLFNRLDVNRDGVISRSEWPADLRQFDRLDLNRDGVLTRSEAEQAARSRRDGTWDDRYGRNDGNMRFRGMDRNGDGVITRGEWRGNDTSFDRHDRNGDGILAGAEVRAGGKR